MNKKQSEPAEGQRDAAVMVHRDDRLSGRHCSRDSTDPDVRSEYERDVDRIHYNHYFLRLAEITQVSSGQYKVLRHNRMTHSLKVAQVGRRLVQYLERQSRNAVGISAAKGIDRDVVTAAGLLHDAGHPPFGHIGEEQLNEWAVEHKLDDGYEGNAQTLRIILSLTAHQHGREEVEVGLDLTRAVIAACVKYPWLRQESAEHQSSKWGYYKPEAEVFNKFVAPLLPAPGAKTLEAEIMEWADDITYAVHDLQDFYKEGIIPLHNLRNNQVADNSYEPLHFDEFSDFWQYVTVRLQDHIDLPLRDALRKFQKYASKFPVGHYRGARDEYAQLDALASQIITDANKATIITGNGRLDVDKTMKAVIKILKQVTWYYVIDRPDLVSTQIGQRVRINQTCSKLFEWVQSCFKQCRTDGQVLTMDERWALQRRLPVQLQEFTEQLLAANNGEGAYRDRDHCYARAVLDYVASMTEGELDRLWRRMCPGGKIDVMAEDNNF